MVFIDLLDGYEFYDQNIEVRTGDDITKQNCTRFNRDCYAICLASLTRFFE